MKRAAEQATSGAMAIFLSAHTKMSFDDARKIPTAGLQLPSIPSDQVASERAR
jgi:hypothetical protein